ncbi:MAG TPA: hypothetical protein DCR21_00850 [Succinivibrionaceae bacterium]|nr:hypothetical protein [Succinivibrio sp.]HAR79356.1 hypothetical protein [Succinivibrionaceae bacterium]
MSLSIPASGMNVSQTYVNSASHNIANTVTEDFNSQQVISSEAAPSNSSGSGAQVSDVRTSSESGVDLSKELASLKSNDKVYQANAKVMQAQNNAVGSLLDTTA